MAHARRQGGKGSYQHQIYGSVKKGLDILIKNFVRVKLQLASLQLVICKAYLLNYPFLIEYTFSASLSTEERAYVHASAQTLGINS